MVKRVISRGRAYYSCAECGFAYETAGGAQKCEEWCKAHHSCNLEITRHAVNLSGQQ